MEVVASLSQGRTAAAQCGLFTHKSVPVIFEPPCITELLWLKQLSICRGPQGISAIITMKFVAMTSERCKQELQDVFRNADNNNRESTYNQLSAAILTPTLLALGYILVLATPLVPTGIHDSKTNGLIKIKVKGKGHPKTGHEGPEEE